MPERQFLYLEERLPSYRKDVFFTNGEKKMQSEKQYIDLYGSCRDMLFSHSADVMNDVRDAAFADFSRQGFPTRKVERYKYTDMQALFAPDYGLNVNRLDIPANPYEAFKCDVPNLSTSLYFILNDGFYDKALPKGGLLPDGVIIGSLRSEAQKIPVSSRNITLRQPVRRATR